MKIGEKKKYRKPYIIRKEKQGYFMDFGKFKGTIAVNSEAKAKKLIDNMFIGKEIKGVKIGNRVVRL